MNLSASQIAELPVRKVLPDVAKALAANRNVVLQSPPGTGKTLLTAPYLLDAPWLGKSKIILLEPRRLAARMAAQAMSHVIGDAVGGTVGYQVRLERKIGRDTRIEVLTEGLLAKRLIGDPELKDVGLVIFDEFHERNLHADFALALLLDAKAVLRPDLRIAIMSATLDAEATAHMLGEGTSIVSAQAGTWPVETIFAPPSGMAANPKAVGDAVAKCVMRALGETQGGILAFLPGEGEIRRAEALLRECHLPPSCDILPLYGSLDKTLQDAAVGPPPAGRRKIVLSTSIAESSLTVMGVSVVIDGGWSRVSRFSHATGMPRLETIRVTRDRADQRRGRAGRLGPGVCYRLWDAVTDSALLDESVPEIVNADLSPVRLDAACWGARRIDDLKWPTPPPEHSWRRAGDLLEGLEALDHDGAITGRGRKMATISAHPRLAHMIGKARECGFGREAALCAAIIEELNSAPLLRGEDDIRRLYALVRGDSDGKAPALDGWTARVRKLAAQWHGGSGAPDAALGRMLSWAYPDRIAQCRDGGALFRLASGHGARLDDGSGLFGRKYLVVVELQDNAADAAIRLAAPVDAADVEQDFSHLIRSEDVVKWDAQSDRIVAVRRRMLGALALSSGSLDDIPEESRLAAVSSGIRLHGVANLGWTRNSRALQARLVFLHGAIGDDWPDVGDEALEKALPEWLAPWLEGVKSWGDLRKIDLGAPLMALAGYRSRELDALAPEHWLLPCGHRARIRYSPNDRPSISAMLQDFFGLASTPLLAGGRVKAKLELLSPAQRPVAVTDDLESFWKNGYPIVRKEMRGRYPKHDWPESPETFGTHA